MANGKFHRNVIFALVMAMALFGAMTSHAKKSLQSIEIITEKTSYALEVEVATKPADLQQGLMFRKHLAADSGMLFVYPEVQIASMWMKNTYIPLDILFMDEAGVIVHMAENTTPFSEAVISSVYPVRMALELAAGSVKKRSITLGDKVRYAPAVD